MELRDALRLLRSETGLTQVELSNLLNVGFSTVSRWENQNTRPNKAAAVAIMKLAEDRRVSSVCLDELGRILFAPRAADKSERETLKKLTEQMKLEQRLLLTSQQLKTAIDNIDVGIIAQRFYEKPAVRMEVFYYNSFFSDTLGYSEAEFAQRLGRHLYFALEPQYRVGFEQKFKDLLSGRIGLEEFTTVVRMARKDKTLIWAEIKAISLHEFSYGHELFTSCRDVTEREESKRAFQTEVAYRDISLAGHYATIFCDLTENRILQERDAAALIGRCAMGSVDAVLQAAALAAPAGADRDIFRRVFQREAMLEAFSRGETTQNLYLFNNIGRRWLRMEYHLVESPDTGHVAALIYAYDVQKQVLSMKMMDTITEHFFDYVGYIDVASGMYETLYSSDRSVKQPFAATGSYIEALELHKSLYADPETAQDDYEAMALERVVERLCSQPFYSRMHHIRGNDGAVIKKKTVFTFLDETRRQIIAAQCDVQIWSSTLERSLDIVKSSGMIGGGDL